jgi:hypothetical protein
MVAATHRIQTPGVEMIICGHEDIVDKNVDQKKKRARSKTVAATHRVQTPNVEMIACCTRGLRRGECRSKKTSG